MLVPRVQLRVFAPLDSFPRRDRDRWRAYVDAGQGLTRARLAAVEDGATLTRLISGRNRMDPGDAALVRRMGPRTMLCPVDLELRAAVALHTFADSVPPGTLAAFLPDESGRRRLESLASSGRVPHILDAPFAPPLVWFLLFDAAERRLRDGPSGAAPRVVHLTVAEPAIERLERVIEAVERHVEDAEALLLDLAELVAWLDVFDPTSLVELDFGAVAASFTREELEQERTCAVLWDAVTALEQGDLIAAIANHDAAQAWWARSRARQHAS